MTTPAWDHEDAVLFVLAMRARELAYEDLADSFLEPAPADYWPTVERAHAILDKALKERDRRRAGR